MNKLLIRKPGESNNKQSSEPKCKRCGKQYVIKGVQVCNCEGILDWDEHLQSSSWEKEAKDIACRAGIDHVAYTYEKICKLLSAQQQEWKEKLEKVLKEGHGGGNWRRLIMQVLAILK